MNCFPTLPVASVFFVAFVLSAALAQWIPWPFASAMLAGAFIVMSVWLWRTMGERRAGVFATQSDVTEQLRDDFLATLSHELRTPLNAMVGWVHLLRMKAPMDPEKALAAIERNAAHQARLIDDLLDVSRALKGGLPIAARPIDLGEIVRSAMKAMQPLAGSKRVAFVLQASQKPAMVTGDGGRLEQAIRNLLSNAVKFTPSGGRVEVTVTEARGSVVVEVRDSGLGVDPAFLPHMFKPFRQGTGRGQRTGLGLGLSIVEEIVNRHGGHVAAHSDGRDRGTSIRVVLPASRAGSDNAGATDPINAAPVSDRPAEPGSDGLTRDVRAAVAEPGPLAPAPWGEESVVAAPRAADPPPARRVAARRAARWAGAGPRQHSSDVTRAAH